MGGQAGDGDDPIVDIGRGGPGVDPGVDAAIHTEADDSVLECGPGFEEGSSRIALTGIFVGSGRAHHLLPQRPVDALAGGLGRDLEFHLQEQVGQRSPKRSGSPPHDLDLGSIWESLASGRQGHGCSVVHGPGQLQNHGIVAERGGVVGWMFDGLFHPDAQDPLCVLGPLVGAVVDVFVRRCGLEGVHAHGLVSPGRL